MKKIYGCKESLKKGKVYKGNGENLERKRGRRGIDN